MIGFVLASTLAAGASISGAHASVANGRLTLTVEASLPLPPESAHWLVESHRLRLEVSGVALNDEHREFGGGEIPVRASSNAEAVTLELALPSACTGELHLEPAPAGLRAELPCPPAAVPVAAVAPVPRALLVEPLPAPAPSEAGALASASVAAPSEAPHAPVAAAVLLVLLGAAAWVYTRRTASPVGHLRIEQSMSIGPRRALVVARLGEELLVLGSSEGGLQLLTTRPAPAAAPPPAPVSLLEQLGIGAKRPSFEELLREGTEDELLRRKLEAGMAGRVR